MPERSRPRTGIFDQRPTPQQGPVGPHLYGGVNRGPVPGIEGGGALFSGSGRDADTGLYGGADMFYAEGYAGGRSDNRVGLGGRVGMFNGFGGIERNGYFGQVNHSLLTAEADAHISDKSAGFAVGADLISGGIEGGRRDPTSNNDEAFGISASISSPGASAHLLYDDADGDGYREYGFDVGGKLGPGVGLKFTTEDPVRTLVGMNPLLNNPLGRGLMDRAIGDRNLTETAGNAGRSAANWVGETASNAWNGFKGLFD